MAETAPKVSTNNPKTSPRGRGRPRVPCQLRRSYRAGCLCVYCVARRRRWRRAQRRLARIGRVACRLNLSFERAAEAVDHGVDLRKLNRVVKRNQYRTRTWAPIPPMQEAA